MNLIQSGPRAASVVIVGEAPGQQEELSGVPFSGGSGQLLNSMLGHVGLVRDACFVTNVVHLRPPKNDFGWILRTSEGKKALILGLLQLKKDLDEIRPNLVVCMGAQALRAVTGKSGIDKWRGSILESSLVKGLKVIGTYHPAYILRVWDYKAVGDFDMRRIAKQAQFSEIRRPERELILDPRPSERDPLIKDMLKSEWLSLDIECWLGADGKWKLACLGVSDRWNRAVCLPTNSPDNLEVVANICASTNKKIFQNGNNFDIPVLKDNGIETNGYAWDTMLMHHCVYPESAGGGDEMSAIQGKKRSAALKRGLGFLTSIHTEEPYYKDDGKLWKETEDYEMFWRYNALDAAVTREIKDRQVEDIEDFGVWPVQKHVMALIPPLMKMTERGIMVDKEVHAELMTKYSTEIERLQSFLDKSAGTPLNVKSSKQIQQFLYDELNLPIQYNFKTGRPTANKDALIVLGKKSKHPALHAILEIRSRRDMVERYLNTPYDDDGAMRCAFDIAGTRTGRLSSRASVSGSGTNLQNQPDAIRKMYRARDGMVLINRDYSQAEARLVAYLARCIPLIELFEDPTRDVHIENAARIFNISTEEVRYTIERYLAKRTVHACNYGMRARKFVLVVNEDADTTGIWLDFPTADRLIEGYFMLYPEIKENYWREVENELKQTRTLVTPLGRKRQFFGRWDDKLLREAYSFIPQSTVGDLTCKGLVQVHREVPQAHLLVNVHDSILVEAKEEDAAAVAKGMAEAMAIPIQIGDYIVTIPTDCSMGHNWGDWDEETNPKGMKKVADD